MERTSNDATFHPSSELSGLKRSSVTTFFLRGELEAALQVPSNGRTMEESYGALRTQPAADLDRSFTPLLQITEPQEDTLFEENKEMQSH